MAEPGEVVTSPIALAEAELERYRAAIELGVLATDLRRKFEEAARIAATLMPDDLDLPTGSVFYVWPEGASRGDTLDLELYDPEDLDWEIVGSRDSRYADHIKTEFPGARERQVFKGRSIETDKETGRAYVYDQASGEVRVLWREGVTVHINQDS